MSGKSGEGPNWFNVASSMTGRVTPISVRSPVISAVSAPVGRISVEVKTISGKFSLSKNAAERNWSSRILL